MAPKVRFWVQYAPFWGFGAQNRFFGPKMRPWRPLRKTLQKHKVLGRFWRPKGGKNQFWEEKGENSLQNRNFGKKAVLGRKSGNSSKREKTSQSVTFFALKHKSMFSHSLQYDQKGGISCKWGENQ